MGWLFLQLLPKLQNGYLEPSAVYLKTVPIPTATSAQRAAIEALVTRVLAARAAGKVREVAQIETQIDTLVYGLYGLTADEITEIEAR